MDIKITYLKDIESPYVGEGSGDGAGSCFGSGYNDGNGEGADGVGSGEGEGAGACFGDGEGNCEGDGFGFGSLPPIPSRDGHVILRLYNRIKSWILK